MTIRHIIVVAALLLAGSAAAETPKLQPSLAGIGFLVGDWSGGDGKVADTGGRSTGTSQITAEAGGGALLRRDHTALFDAAGKPAGGFDQIMMIYPEGGTLHADYADGEHLIHYVSATVEPGHAVTFLSAASPSMPAFRLAYTLADPKTLAISFAMAPPGGGDFRPIATGILTRR